MLLSASRRSEKGGYRDDNEDAAILRMGRLGADASGLFGVADGVGGLDAGEIASGIVKKHLERWWDEFYSRDSGIYRSPVKTLHAAVLEADERIRDYGGKNNLRLATTLSLLLLKNNEAFIFHAGDTAIFETDLETGAVEKLTADHVKISKDGRPMLTQVLGNGRQAKARLYMNRKKITGPRRYYLMTDGAYGFTAPEDLARLGRTYPPDACNAIIDGALRAGSQDNATVVIADVRLDEDKQ